MARMIGRGKGWLWWLAGALCALAFGRGARCQEAQAEYGVRPVGPPSAVPLMPRGDEESRQEAGRLVDAWLAANLSAPAELTDELKARIGKLVGELGSDDFQKRENASAELVRIGRPALDALRQAAKSPDAEVAQRAAAAVEKIDAGPALDRLRGLGWIAQVVIGERVRDERKAIISAAGAAAEAEQAGRKDEAEKLRTRAKEARARSDALGKLAALITQPPVGVKPAPGPAPGPQPLYGVMIARYGVRGGPGCD